MASIDVRNLTIEFPIYDDRSRSLRHMLLLGGARGGSEPAARGHVGGFVTSARSGGTIVRSLNDVSFTLRDGDRVGLVGHNGAGKTTLLRALSGVFVPVGGSIRIEGAVMPLLNISEGLAPDATGAEAIRIKGHLLGLGAREIDDLARSVTEFCELGEFLRMPIRAYSSGMSVRLAFAIATAMTADILLMDEIIGAGDAAFIERAEARLKDFTNRASILVIASHSDTIIRQWCNKALLLEHGRLTHAGDVEEVLAAYHGRR